MLKMRFLYFIFQSLMIEFSLIVTIISQDQGGEQNQQKTPTTVHYAYSPVHLNYLAKMESEVYDLLGQYEQDLLERLSIVRRYRGDYEDSTLRGTERLDKNMNEWDRASFIISHPFMSHRMIRRFSLDIRALNEHMWKSLENNLWFKMETLRGSIEWPTESDLKDSMNSILRLQKTFDVKMDEFTSGIINNVNTNVALRAVHCLEIGDLALKKRRSVTAGDWVKAAHQKVVREKDRTADMEALTAAWERTSLIHNKMWNIDDFGLTDTFDDVKKKLKNRYESIKMIRTVANRKANYIALCRGEELQTAKEKSKLYCWQETNKHPYWLINPQKLELKNVDPFLVQIHDFVSHSVARELNTAVLPNLRKSHVVAKDNNYLARTSSTAWATDFQLPLLIKQFSLKIEFITGLHVQMPGSSEPYQVASYAYGGHYIPHFDALTKESNYNDSTMNRMGERVATFMAYLGEPQLGGETVFTTIGTAIKPLRGSALLWFNMYSNGSVDERTVHAACPVFMGEKWVVTKWIHEAENFLMRPCLLKSDL